MGIFLEGRVVTPLIGVKKNRETESFSAISRGPITPFITMVGAHFVVVGNKHVQKK